MPMIHLVLLYFVLYMLRMLLGHLRSSVVTQATVKPQLAHPWNARKAIGAPKGYTNCTTRSHLGYAINDFFNILVIFVYILINEMQMA